MCFWLCCIWTLICFFISALLGVIPLRQQHNKSWAVTWWGTVRSAQVSWEQTGGGNLSLCVCLCFLKEAELRAAVMVDVIDLWACSGIWKKKKDAFVDLTPHGARCDCSDLCSSDKMRLLHAALLLLRLNEVCRLAASMPFSGGSIQLIKTN